MSAADPTGSRRDFDSYGGFVAAMGAGLGLPLLLLTASSWMSTSGGGLVIAVFTLVFAAFFGGLLALLTTVVLALPVFMILRRTGLLGPGSSAFAGAVVGAPASAVWLLVEDGLGGPVGRALNALYPLALAAPGLVAGVVFWRVATSRARQTRLEEQVEVF